MEMCTLQDTMCHGILTTKQSAQNVEQKLVSQLKGSSIYTMKNKPNVSLEIPGEPQSKRCQTRIPGEVFFYSQISLFSWHFLAKE